MSSLHLNKYVDASKMSAQSPLPVLGRPSRRPYLHRVFGECSGIDESYVEASLYLPRPYDETAGKVPSVLTAAKAKLVEATSWTSQSCS